MTVFYHTVIFIILAISRSIAVLDIPYEGFGDPSSSTPTFIYSSQEPTAIFRGYSYTIDDSTGGNSRVFFVVGPDSFDQVKIEVTRTQPTQNVKSVTLNGATEDTKSLKNETSTVLSENSEKPDKVSTMDENSKMVEKSAEPASKEAGSKQIDQQLLSFQQPYPIFRFNFPQAQYPGLFSGFYETPSDLTNQFYSLYNQDFLHVNGGDQIYLKSTPYIQSLYSSFVPLAYQHSQFGPVGNTFNGLFQSDKKENGDGQILNSKDQEINGKVKPVTMISEKKSLDEKVMSSTTEAKTVKEATTVSAEITSMAAEMNGKSNSQENSKTE